MKRYRFSSHRFKHLLQLDTKLLYIVDHYTRLHQHNTSEYTRSYCHLTSHDLCRYCHSSTPYPVLTLEAVRPYTGSVLAVTMAVR